MRHIGNLDSESKAKKFVAYLITENISAKTEQDSNGWEVWVHDENQLDTAVEALKNFKNDPTQSIYQGVEQKAATILREELRQHEQAQKKVVEMRSKWRKPGAGRRTPLVFALIALSVVATIWTNFGKNQENFTYLSFCSMYQTADWSEDVRSDRFISLRRGEVWRLVTPIFVHLSILHLIFNMYWTYRLGTQIEDRRGTWRLLLLVLATACLSNIAQAGIETPWFGGMSGVGYGLFGYAWMKTRYEPESGIFIPQQTIILFVVWFFICLAGFVGPVANTAHGAGLVVGAAIGYFPVLLKNSSRR